MPIINENDIVAYLKKVAHDKNSQIWHTRQPLDGTHTVAPSYPANYPYQPIIGIGSEDGRRIVLDYILKTRT